MKKIYETNRIREMLKPMATLILFMALLINANAQVNYLNEAFDSNPSLTQWTVDRYAPAAFVSDNSLGSNVLKISINGTTDGAQARPSNYSSSFYNTQGRAFDQTGLNATILKGSLYLPSDWATKHRRSDMWVTGLDASNATASYPIIGFRNITGTTPTFSYWDDNIGWIDYATPTSYDTWYNFEIKIVGNNVEYYMNNALVGIISSYGTVKIGNVIMQAYNFNDANIASISGTYDNSADNSYDAIWDNVITQSNIYNVSLNTFHATIPAAITAASAGNVINVDAGTYEFTSQMNIDKPGISIIGQGNVIFQANNASWSTVNGYKHLIGIYAGTSSDPVTISNITMNCNSQCYGLNTYNNAYGIFNDVSINGSKGAGLTVNGSTVIATNLNTSTNAWGAVNVDPGSGVTTPSVFTLNSGTLAENNQIWSDGAYATGSATVTVNATGYNKYNSGTTKIWTNRALTNCATITKNGETSIYSTIQSAIDAAVAGDVINVTAGTFNETVNLNKRVSLIGAGSGTNGTVITKLNGNDGAINLIASGLDASNPVLIKDLRIQPSGVAGISVGLFYQSTTTNVSFVKLQNVYVIGTSSNAPTEQERGLYVDNTSSLLNLTVIDSKFENLTYGWYFQKAVSADLSNVQYVDVTNTIFNNNIHKGIYCEKISDATFTNCTFDNNGMNATLLPTYFAPWSCGVDVNTKAGNYANIAFTNCVLTNNGIGGAKEGAAMTIKARSDGTTYGAFPATLNNVSITGCTITGNERGIRLGEPTKDNPQPLNVIISNNTVNNNRKHYTGTDGTDYGDVVNMLSVPITLNSKTILAGQNVWYVNNGESISAVITAASAGDIINVGAGTYNENLVFNKSVTLLGPNYQTSPNTGTRLAEAILKPTNSGHAMIPSINGVNVVIKGITIDMASTIEDNRFLTLSSKTNTLWEFENNIFKNAKYSVNGNWWFEGAVVNSLTLNDNLFTANEVSNGLMIAVGCPDISITNNVWENNGYTALNLNNVVGEISSNLFRDTRSVNFSDPNYYFGDYQSGILLASANNNLNIVNNTFNNVHYGIILYQSADGTISLTDNVFEGTLLYSVRLSSSQTGGDLNDVTVSGNSFLNYAGSNAEINNVRTDGQVLNATCNWYGTSVASEVAAKIGGNVTYVPFSVSDGGVCNGGPVQLIRSNVVISGHSTIQSAINAAIAGDVIEVAAGTYTENVIVNKALKLKGANADVVYASRGAESKIIPTGAGNIAVTIASDGVTFNGFELSAPSSPYALSTGGTGRNNMVVKYNYIHNVGTTYTGNVHSIQYNVANGVNTDYVTISNNNFDNINSVTNTKSGAAIGILQSISTGTISHLLIEYNTISNVNSNPATTGGKGAYGIIINVGYTSGGSAISPIVRYNNISNLSGLWAHAIGLEGNTPGANVTNNTIDNLASTKTPADACGVMVEGNTGATTLSIHNNSFTNLSHGIINVVAGLVDATCNWYGTTDASTITSKIYGNVSYIPYSVSDGGACTGYAPVLVKRSGVTISGYSTIQAAISATTTLAGDVIEVAAGTYEETSISVNKVLTINGPNAGLAGNNVSRTAEARINNTSVSVTAAAIIDGFEIYQTNNTADAILVQAAATIKNSVIRREGVSTGIVARGITTAVSTSGFVLQDNLFTGSTSGGLFSGHKTWNSGLYLNGGTGTISGNTFENCRTAINADDYNAGISISGNTFQNSGTFIAFGGTTPTNGQFVLEANNFKTLVSTFINLSNVNTAFRLDITSSTYNGAAFNTLPLATLYQIESCMYHQGLRNGLVTYVANNLYVNSSKVIQNAINYATAGNTVNVAAGTYTEVGQLVINKNLTITGANKTTTIIKPSANQTNWIQVNAGVSLNISKVKFDGTGLTITRAINFEGSGVVNDCWFTQIKGESKYAYGTGVQVKNPSAVNITNCLFDNIGRTGIRHEGTGNVSGNTYTGKGLGDWLDYFILAEYGCNITIDGNTVTNCIGVATSDGSGSNAISVWDDPNTTATITNNILTNNSSGIAFAAINSTTLPYTWPHVTIGQGNVISGSDEGIGFYTWNGSTFNPIVSISNTKIYGNVKGIEISAGIDVSNILVNNNLIYDNSSYDVNNLGTGIINATSNYWGGCPSVNGDVSYFPYFTSFTENPGDLYVFSGVINNIVASSTNANVCAGLSTTIFASGGSDYNWAGLGLGASKVVSPVTNPTTYNVTGKDANGCTGAFDDVVIGVYAAPTVIITGPTSIPSANLVTLTASGADTYLWSTGETGASINVYPTSVTTYSVTGTINTGLCSGTATHTITPVIVSTGPNKFICSGNLTTLTATVIGATPVSYLWTPGGATTQSIEIAPNTTTVYTVTVTIGGSTPSSSVTVFVNSKPVANAGADITIAPAGSGILTGSASNGTAPYSYSWNTTPVQTTANATVSATASPSETYWLTVTDAYGCTSTADDATVSVAATGYTVSGNVAYAYNLVNNQMHNVTVSLKQGSTTMYTTTTPSIGNGNYEFLGVANGTYTVHLSSPKPWGGVTSADIIAIQNHYKNPNPVLLNGIKRLAADVVDNSSFATVNLADRTMVNNKRVNPNGVSFATGNWVFTKTTDIGSNGIAYANTLGSTISITVLDGAFTQNFSALCYGDVDASYTGLKENENSILDATAGDGLSLINFPNPFSDVTTIQYNMPVEGSAVIDIFDLIGNKVASISDPEKSEGVHNLNFNAAGMASGIYIYTVTVKTSDDIIIQNGKMIFSR
jgi:hypothetical protein